MNSRLQPDMTPQPSPNENFSFAPLDDTAALLREQAKRENRDLAPEEWAFLEAETYARRFANRLWLRNVHVSLADREDFRSDYYAGALSTIRDGTADKAVIEKAGRHAVNHFRDWEKSWRKAAVSIDAPKVEKQLFPYAGTKQDVDHDRLASAYDRLAADPLAETHEVLQSGVLENCVDQLSKTRRLVMSALLYGDGESGQFDNKPAVMQVVERLGLSVLDIQKHIDIAEEELRSLMRAAIRNAPSHPDVVPAG